MANNGMPVDTQPYSRAPRGLTEDRMHARFADTSSNRGATHVLFVANASAYGGAEKHLLDLLRKFKAPARITVLCFGLDATSERLNWNGAERIEVRCERSPCSFAEWVQLFARYRCDIVVFAYNWFYAFTWYAPIAARLAGIRRSVAIQHTVAPAPKAVRVNSAITLLRWLIGWRRRYLLRLRLSPLLAGTTTICVSDAVRERLIRMYGFPPKATVTVRNGVQASEFVPDPVERREMRAKLGFGSSDFVFVFVGRLTEQKGVDVLLNAMSKTVRAGARCKCIIVGEGALMEPLVDQTAKLGLSHLVSFVGFQQSARPFLQAADAFILTSHYEGLPLAVLEAMACGLPCLVTAAGGSAEAVLDKQTGLVVPPGAVDEVSAAMSHLINNPSETARMANESRVRATEIFDIDKQMGEIEHLILGPRR